MRGAPFSQNQKKNEEQDDRMFYPRADAQVHVSPNRVGAASGGHVDPPRPSVEEQDSNQPGPGPSSPHGSANTLESADTLLREILAGPTGGDPPNSDIHRKHSGYSFGNLIMESNYNTPVETPRAAAAAGTTNPQGNAPRASETVRRRSAAHETSATPAVHRSPVAPAATQNNQNADGEWCRRIREICNCTIM
ncbi:hypothetical protein B9Z55_016652 [Caenorhabditis nigoni]|uniref:Uncharacterized protein n=1 Tax=Caenorhabditis nigoni TaxID=1611254 RepID=A0A2G5T618_9PELO|nr:hypothetical protein B9Z55_016652 [Caenorhabditis nigoni]